MGLKRWRLVLPKSMAGSLFLGVVAAGSGLALLAVSAWLIVRASQRPPILTLEVAIVSVRFFGLARPVGRYVERLVSHDAVLHALAKVRGQIVGALSRISPASPLLASRGKLLARLVEDVNRTQDLFLRIVSPVITGVVLLAVGAGISTTILPIAGVLTFILLSLAVVIASLMAYLSARQADVDRSALVMSVNELIRGAEELHMWKARERELERTIAIDEETTRQESFAVRGFGLGSLVIFAGLAVTLMMVTPLAAQVHQQGDLSWPAMAVVILLPLALLDVLLPIPTAISLLPSTMRSLDATHEVLMQAETGPTRKMSLPEAPDLMVTKASVSWTGEQNEIADVSMLIPYGTKVAIVGESGAGKTTLALALCGLLPSASGDIRIGGFEPFSLSDADRSTLVTFVAQDSYLFDTSIRENLLIARRDATDEEMIDVLTRVGLRDWVDRYHLGVDYVVGENGAFLSGGQRRRLMVAQGLLSQAPIKIFDEPTAHLDIDSAHALMGEIVRERGTVIVISHLLDSLAGFDEHFYVSHGGVRRAGDGNRTRAVSLGS